MAQRVALMNCSRVVIIVLFLSWGGIAQAAFTVLHKGPSDRLIVFVHGLWSDPRSAFSASPEAVSWPDMMARDRRPMRAGPPLSDYTIAVVGYPAGRADTLSIPQIANRLLDDLYDAGVFADYEQIFFVCHSLGGLVVKELFTDLTIDHFHDARKVAAIFLISTPSQGAPAANFMTKALPQIVSGKLVRDMQTIAVNTYLQSLEARWQSILRHRKTQCPRIYCAYETQQTGPVTIVSQAFTATVCDETPRAENANHLDIVKPKSVNDSIYRWVRGRIAQVNLVECRKSTCSDNFLAIRVPSRFSGPFYNPERYDLAVEIANKQDNTIFLQHIVALFINPDVFKKVAAMKDIANTRTDNLPEGTYFISIYENPGVISPRETQKVTLMGPVFIPQEVRLLAPNSASRDALSCSWPVSDPASVEYPTPKRVIVPASGLGVDPLEVLRKAAPPRSRLLSIIPGQQVTTIQSTGLFVHHVSQWILNFVDNGGHGNIVIVDEDGIKPAGTYDASAVPDTPAFSALINVEQVRVGRKEALRIANKANSIYGNSPNSWALLSGWDASKRSLPIWRLPYIGKDYLNIFVSAKDGKILQSKEFFYKYAPFRTVSRTRLEPHGDGRE